MAYPLSDVLADPKQAARDIEHDGIVFGVRAATGRTTRYGAAILEMTLEPQDGLRDDGYPSERVRVVVLCDERTCAYVLSARERRFKHRNPAPSRSLCLFYDRDLLALRWLPVDGLGEFITIVRRHLVFEEAWRRTGEWRARTLRTGRPSTGSTRSSLRRCGHSRDDGHGRRHEHRVRRIRHVVRRCNPRGRDCGPWIKCPSRTDHRGFDRPTGNGYRTAGQLRGGHRVRGCLGGVPVPRSTSRRR